jgi:hypothetical protein
MKLPEAVLQVLSAGFSLFNWLAPRAVCHACTVLPAASGTVFCCSPGSWEVTRALVWQLCSVWIPPKGFCATVTALVWDSCSWAALFPTSVQPCGSEDAQTSISLSYSLAFTHAFLLYTFRCAFSRFSNSYSSLSWGKWLVHPCGQCGRCTMGFALDCRLV